MCAWGYRGSSVIVVDDDLGVRSALVDLLTMEGYRAVAVSSGESAFGELARGPEPALIVLDLWIPGMGSAAFIRRLRASPHAQVPVMLFSAAGSVAQVDLDADAVLSKSSESTAVVRAVDRLALSGRPRHGVNRYLPGHERR
jgi:CheY-like chemotaxis protein